MLQKEVREQCPNAEFVAMDTMNFWIDSMKDAVIETIKGRRLRHHQRRRSAAARGRAEHSQSREKNYGNRRTSKALVIKRGEYGAALFTKERYFAIPAYPLESVFDPTGAGDTFAGGFMGYLASQVEIDGRHFAPRDDLRLGDGFVQRRRIRHGTR